MANKQLEAVYAETARSALSFEQRYEEIVYWIDKRRRNFDLATLEWEDIRQKVVIHVNNKYHMFDPLKVIGGKPVEFRRWVNKVITYALRNIWRDNLSSFSRPCITGNGGCVFNMGNDQCSKTPSGFQCSECPAYKNWEEKKKDLHAIKMTLSLDTPKHAAEAQNMQGDFVNIEEKKSVIDKKMKGKLGRAEWKMYKLLIIKGLSEREVAKAMGFKKKKTGKKNLYPGYQIILTAKKKFVLMAKEIIEEEGLVQEL
jgi:hypothetical protein